MRTRSVKPSVRWGALLVTIVASVFVFCGPASAHQVTSMTVDCYVLTAHFTGFPEAGVLVHMQAEVSGQQPVSRDVLVSSETTEATLDISSATAALFGATATVTADITWTLEGPQHVHQTLTVTCGSPTTTTAPTTTTTAAPTTTTTLGGQGETSTVPTTARPTTTAGAVAPLSTTPVSGVSPTTSTLPRTGSDPTVPALFGLSAIAAGGLALRRRRPWTP